MHIMGIYHSLSCFTENCKKLIFQCLQSAVSSVPMGLDG